jgi:hypothetical protein
MKFRLALAGLISLAALSASAQSPDDVPKTPLPPQTPVVPFGEPGRSMLIVKDLMRYVLNPAAETFWLAGGEVDDASEQRSRTPTTDAKWNGALAAAATVLETGNMLMMDGRARSDPEWARWSADLNKAGLKGVQAVQARDGEATFAAGSDMFEACQSCHIKYIRRQRQEVLPLPDLPPDAKPKRLR